MQYNYYYSYHLSGILCRQHKFISLTVAVRGSILLSIDTVSKMKMHPVLVWRKFSLTLQATCHGCDYYVTIECAQTISAPLLQPRALRDSHCTSSLRILCVIDEGRGRYGLILHSSSVYIGIWQKVAKFPGRRAVWFDTDAITLKTKEQAKYAFLFYR